MERPQATITPAQRALDLVLVVLLAPFALVAAAGCALAVLVDSPGPVLYRSRRIGCGGRPFAMLKFRTMRVDLDGPPISAAGDIRYTPVGRWLSRNRLDEIPQMVNVLRGQMRLVGPRPEVEEFVAAFPLEYERILSVPPGITGPTQLEFAEEGHLLAAAEDRAAYYRESILPLKLQLDLGYVADHRLGGDLRVLARTLTLPVRRLRAAASGPRPSLRAAVPVGVLAVSLAAFVALFIAQGHGVR
jgi:lipopolysaccharide/colanic/teichoic acid biosynthesis glycosyltransferase